MNVLENQERCRLSLQFCENGRKDRCTGSFFFKQGKELAAYLQGDIVEWTKRARCKQSVTTTPQNAALMLYCFDELLDQRSLSDTGLTAYESDTPVAIDHFGECVLQLLGKVFALE
jgi:hypothetical protein